MEQIRSCHNNIKRTLIQNTVKRGDYVLDVGCGFGGDTHKWKQVGAFVDMCDPNESSVKEAMKRTHGHEAFRVFKGDVNTSPNRRYNVICYNFSIHYIFEKKNTFIQSIKSICDRLEKGGLVIGCIPNSDMIMMYPKFQDSLGNFMIRNTDRTGNGTWGEKLHVQLVDTPYYKDGPKSEPIAYKDLLISEFKKYNVELMCWCPFHTEFEISKMYAYFIFQSY